MTNQSIPARRLYEFLALSIYNSGCQFNIYKDGGAVIHGHVFGLYYGKRFKFNYNKNLN